MDDEPRPTMIELPDDMRTAKQRRAGKAAADKQLEQLRGRWHAEGLRRTIAETMVSQRNSRAREDDRKRDYVSIGLIGPDDEPIMVVLGELLIRDRELTDAMRGELEADGWQFEQVDKLDGRVWLGRHKEPERRAPSDRESVHDTFVAPMGVVMKAARGPEPADGRSAAPPESGLDGIPVAVIDTGVTDIERGDDWLAGVPVDAGNLDVLDDIPADGRLDAGAGHGTFATGIIRQLAPDSPITVYRVLDSDGLGSESTVATTMVAAAEAGAKILNLSFGLETDDDDPPIALEAAVEIIRERFPDVVLVGAAGNFGRNRKCWPGAFKQVTAVAGLTRDLDPAEWSSHGPWVDCSTIGEGVLSIFVEGTEADDADPDVNADKYLKDAWAVWTGTSFAAPQVVGAVAQIAQREGIAPRDALARLLATGKDVALYGRAVEILPAT